MPLLPSASDSEPLLILTDQDYQKAFAPEPAAAKPPAPPQVEPAPAPMSEPLPEPEAVRILPAPKPVPLLRSRWWISAAAILLIWVGIAAVWFWPAAPAVPPKVTAARPRSPEPPKPVEPTTAPEPPPRPVLRATPVPPPESDVDEPPLPPAPAPAKAARIPWLGDRAWIFLKLRIERAGQAQESDQRVTVAWDGTRYVLERPDAKAPELWRDRLELLFQLPVEDESWQRQVTRTSAETIHVRAGDLACKVVEGEDRFPQGVRKFRYSYSDEFPAGAVEARQTLGGFTVSCRVLDFGAAAANKP